MLLDYIMQLVQNEDKETVIMVLSLLKRIFAVVPSYQHDQILEALMGGEENAE